MSYAKGSDANPLQDTSGNEVVNFSGQQVTNNAAPARPAACTDPTGTPETWFTSVTSTSSSISLKFADPLPGPYTSGSAQLAVCFNRLGWSTGSPREWVYGTNPPTAGQTVTFTTADGTVNLTAATDYWVRIVGYYGVSDSNWHFIRTKDAADTTVPVLQSATVDGATLTLTYNEALKATNAPDKSRFTVAGTASATTVTAVGFKSGDAKSVELTLSPAVTAGDSGITVSYTQGNDANPLQDAAGNAAGNFSGQQVTNNTRRAPPTGGGGGGATPLEDTAPSFGAAAVSSLTLVLDEAMEPVVLPEATGGNGAPSYALTSAPAGLAGLSFDPASRRLSGTPSAEGSYDFTYTAHDAGRQPGGLGRGSADVCGDGGEPARGADQEGGEAHACGGGAAGAVERAGEHRRAVRGLHPGFRPDAGGRERAARRGRRGRHGPDDGMRGQRP